MTTTLIQDTFKYFAKYPLMSGVLKNFNKPVSDPVTAYDTFKASIAEITPNSLITDLNDYIFGVDIISLKKRVEAIDGIYLFIDYGNIYDTLIEPMKTEQGEFNIAVTIAKKTQPDDKDQIEQVLLADKTLGMITQLKDTAKYDANRNHFLKYLTFPTEISSLFMPDISNSVGWTMTFRIKGAHLV